MVKICDFEEMIKKEVGILKILSCTIFFYFRMAFKKFFIRYSSSSRQVREYTTVTKRLRRVFEQDYETLKRATMVNKPDELSLMFLDYINAKDRGKEVFEDLSSKSQDYVFELEERLKVPIRLIGTGPEENHIIDRRCAH